MYISHSPTEAASSGTLDGELADCSTLTPFVRRQKTSTNTSTTTITNNSTPTIINAIASGDIFITYPGGGGGFEPLVVLVCVECVVGGGVGVGVGARVEQGREGEIGNEGWPVIPLRFVLWILGQLLKLALWQNTFIFESCSSAKLKFDVFSAMKTNV